MICSEDQLNFFRAMYIVMDLFTGTLRDVFKKQWNFFYPKCPWNDMPSNGKKFVLLESPKNQKRNKARLKIIKLGDSTNFDNTTLFYCLLYSNAVGQRLKKKKSKIIDLINKLRQLRNNICHVGIGTMPALEFTDFGNRVLNIFQDLSVSTNDLQSIKNGNGFETNEVNQLKRQLKIVQNKINDFEDSYQEKFSAMPEFCKRFDPKKYIDKIVTVGIISPNEGCAIKQRDTSSVQVTIIVDKIVYGGESAICSFIELLGQEDIELRDMFVKGIMKYNPFVPIKTIEIVYPSVTTYPQHYKSVMKILNRDVYSSDWDKLALHAGFYMKFLDGKEIKLYIQIELAWAKNMQGESEQALQLLESVIQNAVSANNSVAILSRACSTKSIVFRWRREYKDAQFYADHARQIISYTTCDEDLIMCNHQLASIILDEEKDMDNKKRRIVSHWEKIKQLCQRNLDVFPKSTYGLRLLCAKKAMLFLGFSDDNIQPVSIMDIKVASQCISEIEKPYLNQEEIEDHITVYITMCKSLLKYYLGSKVTARDLEKCAREFVHQNGLYNESWKLKLDSLHRIVHKNDQTLTCPLLF